MCRGGHKYLWRHEECAGGGRSVSLETCAGGVRSVLVVEEVCSVQRESPLYNTTLGQNVGGNEVEGIRPAESRQLET